MDTDQAAVAERLAKLAAAGLIDPDVTVPSDEDTAHDLAVLDRSRAARGVVITPAAREWAEHALERAA